LDPHAPPAGTLIVTGDQIFLVTDFRYDEQARAENPELHIVLKQPGLSREAKLAEIVGNLVKGGEESGRIGFESSHLVVRAYDDLKASLPERVELVPIHDLVESLRIVKDEDELSRIGRAAQIADLALIRLLQLLRPGMSEKEAAWELEKAIREGGAEDVAFDLIVASGPNAALPHAVPTSRLLAEGEPIVIDLGARYSGYASDMTRTVWLGEPSERLREVYTLVLKAQMTAMSYLRAGPTGEEVDAAAREVIAAAGYGDRFGHGIGPWSGPGDSRRAAAAQKLPDSSRGEHGCHHRTRRLPSRLGGRADRGSCDCEAPGKRRLDKGC
ncbi:MAG: Xaa-Pro peptidase family protein, partial [Chloroflexi bacterium]|nr:Xaa-Pro peptidase family protein [Chloroflexota bacterium]